MACGTTVAKYLVFVFNLLFFLAGILLIVIGALQLTSKAEFKDVVPDAPDFSTVAILFIVVGAIVTIIAFFGCCGAIQENVCMLNTFAILLIIIILAEVAIAIAALVFRKQMGNEIKKGMLKSLRDYGNDKNITKQAWDSMQKSWLCCGVNNATDWKSNNKTNKIPPPSCCKTNSTVTTCSEITSYKKGCFPNMEKTMNALYLAIGVIGLVVGIIEIVGIILACCLSKAVKFK